MNIIYLRTNKKTFSLSAAFYDKFMNTLKREIYQTVTMVMYKDFDTMHVEIFRKKMNFVKHAQDSMVFIIQHISEPSAAVCSLQRELNNLNSLLELKIDGSTIFTKSFTKNADINIIKKMSVLIKRLQSKGDHSIACDKIIDIKNNYINTGIVLQPDLVWMNNMNLYISRLKI